MAGGVEACGGDVRRDSVVTNIVGTGSSGGDDNKFVDALNPPSYLSD